ncbi:hypothetical protein ETB97_012829 [Aspergillus alliaceus]|uniref:Uncharacterized protein n=1 Tax=Petromyces alliaceus TaxID=209559 RepID=A0A8H6A5U2_PETAA|nr:hypothetical protein ETB97_012829 [Aspergillus burnettii]
MSRAMKALLLTKEPEASAPTLSLTNLPIPLATPGYGLIKVHFSVIQPSDKYNSIGGFPKTTFPRIPGRDYSGTVIDIAQGPNNAQLDQQNSVQKRRRRAGRRARWVARPILYHRRSLHYRHTIPKTGKDKDRRCSPRLRSYQRSRICRRPGRKSNGLSACVDCVSRGKRQTGYMDRRRRHGRGSEARPISHGGEGRKGVDVVVDTIGNLFLMNAAIEALALRGRYAWIASPRDGSSTRLDLNIFRAYRKEIGLTLTRWFDSGVISPGDESIFDIVDLDDAVERGYKAELGAKQVVIAMD